MKILYKYYNTLPQDYILNPTIKLTPPVCLNDPFESILPEELLDFMKKDRELRSLTNQFKARFNRSDNDIVKIMEHGLAHCGIVSLSETQRNLLMWAHYGAQHKGLCIGYKENLFENELELEDVDDKGDVPYFEGPIKMNYDTTRFDPNGPGIKLHDNQSIIFNVLAHVLTTKSDEWIYEKEHRYIVPITWGDCYYSSKMYFDQKNKNKIITLDEGEYISYIPKMFKLNTPNEKNVKLMSVDSSHIMKKIACDKIESIYFGCKADKKYANNILALIQNNSNLLGHIRVYRFTESKSRFELTAQPLYRPFKKIVRKTLA